MKGSWHGYKMISCKLYRHLQATVDRLSSKSGKDFDSYMDTEVIIADNDDVITADKAGRLFLNHISDCRRCLEYSIKQKTRIL